MFENRFHTPKAASGEHSGLFTFDACERSINQLDPVSTSLTPRLNCIADMRDANKENMTEVRKRYLCISSVVPLDLIYAQIYAQDPPIDLLSDIANSNQRTTSATRTGPALSWVNRFYCRDYAINRRRCFTKLARIINCELGVRGAHNLEAQDASRSDGLLILMWRICSARYPRDLHFGSARLAPWLNPRFTPFV